MTQKSFRQAAFLLLALVLLSVCRLGLAQTDPIRVNSNQRFTGTELNRSDTFASQPRAPFPPLSKDHQEYIGKLLDIWEGSSRQIERYRCKFTAWEFDPVFLRPDPQGKVPAKTIAEGSIQFSKPDKGMYKVEKIFKWTPPKKPGEKPQYVAGMERDLEQWICDGESVFIFDYPRQRLLERPLPPEMRGRHIVDGPLPFLFGIEAEKLKQRYWLRVITPPGKKDEYWLEVWPKRREDAGSYKKLEVILSRDPFLPKALQIFPVNYDEKTRPISTVYEFRDQEINFGGLFGGNKIKRPNKPSGWEYEKLDWRDTAPGNQTMRPSNGRFDNARRPGSRIQFPK